MKSFTLLSFLILQAFSLMAQQNSLNKYEWKNRLLIIYSNDVESNKLQEQKNKYYLSRAEYNERDLLVFHLTDNNLQNLTKEVSEAINISSLKEMLSIAKEDVFKVSLIGKDGGIKLQIEKVLTNQKLFATIDAMPMRRNEMSDN